MQSNPIDVGYHLIQQTSVRISQRAHAYQVHRLVPSAVSTLLSGSRLSWSHTLATMPLQDCPPKQACASASGSCGGGASQIITAVKIAVYIALQNVGKSIVFFTS